MNSLGLSEGIRTTQQCAELQTYLTGCFDIEQRERQFKEKNPPVLHNKLSAHALRQSYPAKTRINVFFRGRNGVIHLLTRGNGQ